MRPWGVGRAMRRTVGYAIAGVVAAVAVILVLALYPVPRSHQASISLPTPAEISSALCGTTIQNESFPGWFSGTAHLHWTSNGTEVGLWLNQSSTSSEHWTVLYVASGVSGSTSFTVRDSVQYRFTAQNCNPVPALVDVSLTVPYAEPILS